MKSIVAILAIAIAALFVTASDANAQCCGPVCKAVGVAGKVAAVPVRVVQKVQPVRRSVRIAGKAVAVPVRVVARVKPVRRVVRGAVVVVDRVRPVRRVLGVGCRGCCR